MADKKWVYHETLDFDAEETQLIDEFFEQRPNYWGIKKKTLKQLLLGAITGETKAEG